MTLLMRSRRGAAARMTRWLVLVAASAAVLAVGVFSRSWERDREGEAFVQRRSTLPVPVVPARAVEPEAAGLASGTTLSRAPLDDLRSRRLVVPVEGAHPEQLVASFDDGRGDRRHEAIDILAPIGTPVVAVEPGRIEKLFVSERGGLTIYQFDPLRRYAYYYAHLSRYADGLREGQDVARGQVIGHVGVSGNAPPDTPHLHFAIFQLGREQQWWKGTPIDPYLVWRPQAE